MDINDLIGEVSEKAKIVKLEVVGFKDAFRNPDKIPKDRAEKLKNRDFLKLTVKHGEHEFSESHQIPNGLKLVNNTKWSVTDKLALARSLKNTNSWFRGFLKSYRDLPHVNQEIQITLNDKGFARIKV